VTVDRLVYVLRFADVTEHNVFLCNYISGEPHLPADSPEALEQNVDNRFEPKWIPLADLAAKKFLVWQPIQQRLLHDLEHGFAPHVVDLA
jgi:hypothetical protein